MITVGLDAGTTTISGVVYDSATQSVLKTCTLPNKGQIRTNAAGENLQDAAIIWDTCQSLLEGFLKEYPRISGIGLSGQMHGVVYVDKNGQAINPLATWQDGRGDQPYQDGKSYVHYLKQKSGYHIATGFGLATHFYNIQNRLVPDGATVICTIADYIGMRLARRKKPLAHASNAHSLGMFDLNRMEFDKQAIESIGIDPSIVPDVAQGEAQIGESADGIPVWIAIGDNQASFLGAAGTDYDVVSNIGTSSQLSVRSKTLVNAEGLDIRPHVNGEFILVGAGLCGGSAYALLHSLLQEVLEMYGVDGGNKLYEKMEQSARKINDNHHPLKIDTRFRGTRITPEIRGAITQIGIDNFSVGHLTHGVMRGICDELYGFYEEVPDALRKADVMIGGGNALRHNTMLREILAERFGMDVKLSPYLEESAVGASLLASN
jgi:sedoheptulokinase